MGNESLIEGVELLVRDASILREKLIRTNNNQFESNTTEKRRIKNGIMVCRKKISNLIHSI